MPRHALAALISAVALACACATNPATGRRELSLMSEDRELQVGRDQDAQVRTEMGVYADSEAQAYVSDIGLRLAQVSERPGLPWHFTVVDSPAVNAFALPGGYIYVTRGILPFLQNEAQLAGVLGHEIGHVTARHGAQQYSRAAGAGLGLLLGSIFVPQARPLAELGQTGLGVLLLKYGRDDEVEADELGVTYASKAGWDPAGIPQMLATLGRIEDASDSKGVPNWLSTHPAADDRVQRVQAAVRQAETGAARFTTNADGFLKRIDGLVFGDSPAQGLVRGRRFLHAGLRLAIEFPADWSVTNGSAEVTARESGTDSAVVLQVVSRPAGRTMRDVALRGMEGAGFRLREGHAATIHGLDAFVGTFQGSMSRLGPVTLRVAYIDHAGTIFLVAGIARDADFARVEPALTACLDSFRPLTPGEAERVRPNRVAFYTARSGDTWQALAEHHADRIVKATMLAVMNGHAVDDQPRSGERLKVVVGE